MWLSSLIPKFRRRNQRSIFNGFVNWREYSLSDLNQFNVSSVVDIMKSYPDLLLNCIEYLMIRDINFTFDYCKFLRLFQIAISFNLKRIKFINWTIPHIKQEDFILYNTQNIVKILVSKITPRPEQGYRWK